MKLNRIRKVISANIQSGSLTTIVFADSEATARVELLLWPLQETPSITILLENLDLELNGESGILKTVHFTIDHIETDLEPSEFHIPEREGFVNTSLKELQEYLAKEWNA